MVAVLLQMASSLSLRDYHAAGTPPTWTYVDVDDGHSFIVALVANHEVNQQNYADSWIVSPDEPYGSRVDSGNGYNFGIGNVHHWGFGDGLCGPSAWTSVAQGVVAEVTIYESSGSGSFKEYRCNQGSLDLKSTCTTILPGPFRHAITLFEHPMPSHSGHDARGSLASTGHVATNVSTIRKI